MGKTIKEVLALDYYADNNAALFQKCLKKIKPFENEEDDVKLDLLEKYVGLVCRKYDFQIDYINLIYVKNERNFYNAYVRDKKSKTNQYITDVYASSIYELFVKLSILFYSEIKKAKGE